MSRRIEYLNSGVKSKRNNRVEFLSQLIMTTSFLFQALMYLGLGAVMAVGVRNDEGSGEAQEYDWDENPDYGGSSTETCLGEGLKEVKNELKMLRASIDSLRSKLDPNFNVSSEVEKSSKKCPHGFHYLPKARGCYRIVYEIHNWTSADDRCRQMNPRAHLVAITTREENDALVRYLGWDLQNNVNRNVCTFDWHDHEKRLWTGGHRRNFKCPEPFVWQLSPTRDQPLSYTNWGSGEPNCQNGREDCLNIMPVRKNYRWNDIPCDFQLCPVCEYNPPNS